MPTHFSKKDLDIFKINGFAERMAAFKEKIRPKLIDLGEELKELLKSEMDFDFYPHTAKHARRKVNPPDETWVALGPEKRGYKAYVWFGLCVGKDGASTRVVMKDESSMRVDLGKNLAHNLDYFIKEKSKLKGLHNYLKRDEAFKAQAVEDLAEFLKESSHRLKNLKSAVFDAGLSLDPLSKNLAKDAVKNFSKLQGLFLCGLQKGVRL
ncbi:MAG: DUF1054 family protein [Deltaproteobacteria bacterium]|nr:DUF1054 family protein [Deltaproteobacteria bacterium]